MAYISVPGLMSCVESSDDDEDDMDAEPVKKRRLTKKAPDSQHETPVAQTERDVSPAQPRSRSNAPAQPRPRSNAPTKKSVPQADSHSATKGKGKASSSGARPGQAGGLARLAAASSGQGLANEGGTRSADTAYGGEYHDHSSVGLLTVVTICTGGGAAALFSAKRLGDNFAELRTDIDKLATSVKTNDTNQEATKASLEVVINDMLDLDAALQRHRKRIKELAHNTGVLNTRLTKLEERFEAALDGPLAVAQNAEDPEPVAGTKRKRGDKVRDNNLQVSIDRDEIRSGARTHSSRRMPPANACPA